MTMTSRSSQRFVVLTLLLVNGMACGGSDDDNAGGASSDSGVGGAGSGGTSSGGRTGGGGGQSGLDGAETAYKCQSPLPDPGDDACLACALTQCCDVGSAGLCLSPALRPDYRNDAGVSYCYEASLLCASECYQREMGGSSESPWETAARCTDECLGDDPGSNEPPFPGHSSGSSILVECIIGSAPRDGDASTPTDDDAGAGRPICVEDYPRPCVAESPCAEVCFPGWH